MKKVRVSAAVIHSGTSFLVARKAKGNNAGYWEFPGGKREYGESGEETLLREIHEELGATIEVESLLATISYSYPDLELTMDCYLAHLTDQKLTLTEHDELRWLSLSELEMMKFLDADLLVIDQIRKHFTG